MHVVNGLISKAFQPNNSFSYIQGDTKKRELLKCVVAAMYSWQHCGTGTFSYRQPRHLVIMDQWNGQQRAFAIKMFYSFVGFSKSSRFFVSPCISLSSPMDISWSPVGARWIRVWSLRISGISQYPGEP